MNIQTNSERVIEMNNEKCTFCFKVTNEGVLNRGKFSCYDCLAKAESRRYNGFEMVTIPNRDNQGYLLGAKSVLVEWKCPTCGEIMGDPVVKQFCEDGEFYSVHTWENDCGHVAKYNDLKEVGLPF